MKRILVATLFAVLIAARITTPFAFAHEAQDQTEAKPAPAAAAQDPKVTALEAQVKQLQAQLAAVAQQRQVSPVERQAQAARVYQQLFQSAKDDALAACRRVGGVLRVTVQSQPSAALSVSCELR